MAREKGDVECTWKLSNLRVSLSGPEWTGRAIDCFVEGIFFDTKERSFKTEVSRNTKEPRFNYCTMFRCVLKPDIVQKKHLRLYLKDAAASGAEIGRVHVTVQLLLTGPVNHSLSLVKVSEDGQTAQKVGMIHFACEVDEIELCSVVLNDVVLPTEAAHPALQNGKGLLMKIEHTNRPDNASGWDTKYRIKQTSVTEKGKQGKNGPLWKEMEPIIFECSLRELMKQSIQLSFLDRARPDAAPLAKGELLLRTFLVAVRGQPRQQTTVDAYLKDGKGVEIAKLSATIEFHRLPHYAQLTGGLHQDGGVEGGAPLFPGVPAPLVEMNHPDMYITVNAKSPRLGKSDKTAKIPALSSSPPPGRAALTDSGPEFVEQGTLSPRKEKEKEVPDTPLSPRSRDLKAAKKREKEEREREEKERKEKEKEKERADKERREREKQAEKERVEREAKEAKAAKAGLSRSKTATALRSASPPQVPEPTKPEARRSMSGSLIISKSTPPPARTEASSPPPHSPPPEASVPAPVPLAAVASAPAPAAAPVAAPEGATLSRSGKSWSRLVDPSPSIVSAPRTGIYGAPSPSYDSNGMPLDRGWEFVMIALEAAFPPGHAFDLESSLRGNDAEETRGRAPTDPALAILQREKTPAVKPSVASGPAPSTPQSPATTPAPRPSRPSGRTTVGAAPNTLGRLPSHTSSFAPSQYSAPPPHDPTAAAQLPLGWEEKTDSHGRKYYVDHVTKTTSWTAPRSTTSLPPGWEKRRDAQGRTYYVDHVNRKTQWAPPPGAQEP